MTKFLLGAGIVVFYSYISYLLIDTPNNEGLFSPIVYGFINLFICIVISLIRYEKTGGWIMSAAKKDVEDNLEDNYFVFTGDCIATLTLVLGVGCLFY